MNEIQSTLTAFLPHNRKNTPSGWISFNAVCCHHTGEKRDTRLRGGILLTSDGFQYHCFNCNFKAGWTNGKLISSNTKKLFHWLGINDSEISRLSLYALKMKDNIPTEQKTLNFELKEKSLPDGCKNLMDWLDEYTDLSENQMEKLTAVKNYLEKRGMKFYYCNWQYTFAPGYDDRIIIPFTNNKKIIGFTARKIKDGTPKYISDSQPGYVFNLDNQSFDKKYVIVVEGPFDALAIEGVAILSNDPNEAQIQRINNLNKEVIVVPDRDLAGLKLIDVALKQGWSVSIPPWRENIKDVADANVEYERLYTLYSILHYRQSGSLKIELLKKKFEGYLEALKNITK